MQKKLFNQLPEHPAFELFWRDYPRKIGKGAARTAFQRSLKKVDPEVIIRTLRNYSFPKEMQFIPHASTWLNQERWEDKVSTTRVAEPEPLADDDLHPSIVDLVAPLRRRVGDAAIKSWFKGVRLNGKNLIADSRFKCATIRARYEPDLRLVIEELHFTYEGDRE